MPFGIDDALIWGPLAGAALGGVMGKKPLQGALLGGAAGYGATSIPGLLGAAPAVAETAAPSAAIANEAATSATTPNTLQTASSYLKPIGSALGAASSAKGLLSSPQQPIQASPVMTGQGGAQTLAQLAQNNSGMPAMQDAQQRAQRRASLLGSFGVR